MPTQINEVLQRVHALEPRGEVNTSHNDIGFEAPAQEISEDEFFGILEAVHTHPEWFRDFELRCNDPPLRLFAKSGDGVVANSDEFEELAELDLTTDPNAAERGFTRYRDTDFTEAVEFVHTLIEELHSQDGRTVTLNGIVNKSLLETELAEEFPQILHDEVNVFLWPDPSELNGWISDHPIDQVIDAFFAFERLPVFVFETGVATTFDGVIVTTLEEFDDLEAEAVTESRDEYQEAMQLARRGTVWRDELSPVSPSEVIPLIDLATGFEPILIYSIFGVFSASVELVNDVPKFTITTEPLSFEKRIDPQEASESYTQLEVEELIRGYNIFSEHADKAAFRDFWRLAIANTCEDLLEVPNHVNAIRGYYEDLQVDAIEENFADLSEAIQQIHSFMTGITNRVSDAATQLSQQIQTLIFTLIGAILANMLLVLRGDDITHVPPFSLSVLIVLIGFYFPLIQDRITDLSNIRAEVENDYTLYESEIRRFSEQIFDFEKLSSRKDSYLQMAEDKETWAQDRLDLIFKLLIVVWAMLAIWSFTTYPVNSLQTVVGVLSLLALLVIRHFHSSKDYFAGCFVAGCELIGFGVLGGRLLIEFVVLAHGL